ncbi:MAG: hypothetical protein GC168_20885 [Candidatus Hydrogenedens sp.]|nr:hypothetical protein [Candidatus Hydrogenedens sp.]
MTDKQIELELMLTRLKERREELHTKIEQTRELLAKADSRRAAERDKQAKWDATLNNLEASYDALKREYERVKMETENIERELATLTEAEGVSLDTMIRRAEVSITTEAAQAAAPAASENNDGFSGKGLIRVLSTPLDRLARLSVEQLQRLSAAAAASEEFNQQERDAIVARFSLAIEATGSMHPDAPNPAVSARRQFVLRGAVDKIQRRLVHELTQDEADALIACHGRLAKNPARTPAENRLMVIIGEAMRMIRRGT